MKTQTINPVVAVQPSQLRDDVLELALANGFSLADVERLERQNEYRKAYSQRPNVVAKRKAYSAQRYEKMKVLRNLLKEAGC